MTLRERVEAVFDGRRPDRVPWQPRCEEWFVWHQKRNSLPRQFQNASMIDFYRELGCSVRPYWLFNPAIQIEYDGVDIEYVNEENTEIIRYRTVKGTLVQKNLKTDLLWAIREFPVKSVKDISILEQMLLSQRVKFERQAYDEGLQQLNDLSVPMIFIPRTPLQRLFIEYLGYERTIFFLQDHPQKMEHLINVIMETDDLLFDVVIKCPIQVINFGDNVDSNMLSPQLFEKYLLDYYQRRCAELHAAGKFVFPHWDGCVKPLLPYLRDIDFDGVEALTPLPQGDVTLAEVREAMPQRMVLIDGIPATHFLAQTSFDELETFVREIIDMFGDKLILGISDELSPTGDITKVRFISELVEEISI